MKTASRFPIAQSPNRAIIELFHFFVRGVLTATTAEFFKLQPLGRRFTVLRCRIVPLFAITALHCNDLSGHTESS